MKKQRIASNLNMTSRDPHRQLAAAVLGRAIYEWKHVKTMAEMRELLSFWRSGWFEDLCDLAGVNPDAFREKLMID